MRQAWRMFEETKIGKRMWLPNKVRIRCWTLGVGRWTFCRDSLDRHLGFSVCGMEREFLSRRFARSENAALLRRAILDDGNQLHFSSDPSAKDDRKLENAYVGKFPVRAQSTSENHPLVETPRLHGHAGILPESCSWPRRATRPGSVSIATDFQKRCRCVEFVSSRTAGNARRVRVSPRIVVRRRNFQSRQIAQYRALHRRYRR